MKHVNFHNITIIVTTLWYSPYTAKTVDNLTGEITYSGLFFEALNIFSKDLGFRYQVIEPPDRNWGVENENGTFNGMIGMVSREEADIGIGGFTITAERRRAVDFLQPWWEEHITYLMRKNPVSAMDNCFKPISVQVWLLCTAAVATLTICFWISKIPWSSMPPRFDSSLKRCAWYCYQITASALKQSLGIAPKRGSMRLLFATWWLCSLIISVAYSANLVAIMSVVVDSVPVNSLDELSTHANSKIALTGKTALSGMLEATDIPLYKKIHENLDVETTHEDYEFLVDKYVLEGMIFLGERGGLKEHRAQHPLACSLALGKDSFYVQNIGFPVRKSFPYKDEFNKKILQIIESGLMEKWRKAYLHREPYCLTKSMQARSATMLDLFGAYSFLAVGLTVASLALVCERNDVSGKVFNNHFIDVK